MELSFGVLLVLAVFTFLLAAVLQCLSLRKQEDLIARLERLQGPHVRWREELPNHWHTEDLAVSSHEVTRRPGT